MKKIIPFFIVLGICLIFLPIAFADLDDGLEAYYPFNGNAKDETGHGYDGMVEGATPTEDRNGLPASAYAFDGIDDYINLGMSLDVPSWTNYAVSIWFLHDGGGTTAQGYGQQILDKSTWYKDFHLQIQTQDVSSGELKYWTNQSGGWGTTIIDPRDFRDNQWHHVVINKQGNEGALWVDGVLIGTSSKVWTVYNNQPMLVGYTFHTDIYQQQHFSGKIDDIRMYNRVLSRVEILKLFEKPPKCNGIEATIFGTSDHDVIKGTAGPDVIHGLGGHDVIEGMGGDDIICGGEGADHLSGGDGNDYISGGKGHDVLSGGPGDDELWGNWGNDTLFGCSGYDVLWGGTGPSGGTQNNNDTCYDALSSFIQGCEVFYER